MSNVHRTDSRPLAERKASVQMRRVQVEAQLTQIIAAEAEIDRLVEEASRAAEAEHAPESHAAE